MACPVIRHTLCKSVLIRSGLGDYSLNCYTGCAHACVYCYARFMQRFHPHPEPWGEFVDAKVNAPEALARQLRRARPGSVFVSSACDGWQPLEADLELTRECCRLLLTHGFQVNVLTKSALVLRDLDLFAGRTARVGVTLTTLDEGLRRLWEPGASPVADRLRALREAKRAGLPTAIMFGPLLPFLSDDAESLDALFSRAAELDVDAIWWDGLNPRPRVWESVAALLRREYPELLRRCGNVLYDEGMRAAYLSALRERVLAAAERAGVRERMG
ncbi:MAG: radical SAM protein [Armatimonadetes bacterium]|nr:radical SAM protein [Armatimonadota bacterium]